MAATHFKGPLYVDGVNLATSQTIATLNATTINTTTSNQTTNNVGASGTAGTIQLFPTTASKGKTTVTMSDNTGNTTTAINVAAQAGAVTYTVPDAGASASFVMTEGAQTVNGAKTFGANPVLATGIRLDLASTTATLSSNAATITEYACTVTTESLNTAGGASQELVITKTGVTSEDFAMLQYAGGTNTTRNFTLSAVCTTDTVTVTVYNNTAATALNGTIIFKLIVHKA